MASWEDFTPEQLWQMNQDRESMDAKVSLYAPKFSGNPAVADIYKRLIETEEFLVPNGDYVVGSARVEDDLLILHGLTRVLLTAEHATIQRRRKDDVVSEKEADMGTGVLAEVVAQDTNSTAIIARGRQTGDPNWDAVHPFKDVMATIIESPDSRAHLSLHMLDRGRASDPVDTRGYSIMLGIGKDPSEATLALKDYLKGIASDLDLKLGVNRPHINFDSNHRLRLNEDGSLKTVTFAGAGANTTRSFSERLARELGRGDEYASIQVEVNEVLLSYQNDEVDFPTHEDRQLSSYLGYLFTKLAAESVAKL